MKISSLTQGKKRYVAAAVAAATLGGGAFAYANSLTVTSDTLASGSHAVASCQAGTINVTYATTFVPTANSGAGGYDVSTVTLNGLNSSCNGKTATINLTDGTSSLGTVSGPVTGGTSGSTGSQGFTPSPEPDAGAVTGVAAVITG